MAPKRPPTRRSRQPELLLALGSVVLLLVYLVLPTSSTSRSFALRNLRSFPDEWALYRQTPDHQERFHRSLSLNHQVATQLGSMLAPDDVALLPPRELLLDLVPPNMAVWSDPRVIYYVAGPVRTVAWGGERAETATHVLMASPRPTPPGAPPPGPDRIRINVVLVELDGPEAWDEVRRTFGRFGSGAGAPGTDDDVTDDAYGDGR